MTIIETVEFPDFEIPEALAKALEERLSQR
jgi:hypothetical protein